MGLSLRHPTATSPPSLLHNLDRKSYETSVWKECKNDRVGIKDILRHGRWKSENRAIQEIREQTGRYPDHTHGVEKVSGMEKHLNEFKWVENRDKNKGRLDEME